MNVRPIVSTAMSIILLVLSLAACGSRPDETPIPPATISISNITENNTTVGQIIQKKTFNQCDSASPVKATIQFSETSGQTSQKSLVLKEGGGIQVGLPKLAELQVEAALEEHFSVTNQTTRNTTESINIEVPARTRQEYTIVWSEIRREGTIEYTEDGMANFINYSYRIGVELESSSVKDIDCSFPTETPIPTFTPPATITPQPTDTVNEPTVTPQPKTLSQNCIHQQHWKPDSTEASRLGSVTLHTDGCYSMESIGIFTDSAGTLHLNYRDQRDAIAAGIFTPIRNGSVIEFKVFVNSMYIVYKEKPVTVSFAVAPQDDPMTAKNTARFKLHVEDEFNKPMINCVRDISTPAFLEYKSRGCWADLPEIHLCRHVRAGAGTGGKGRIGRPRR
jgi:hypothetical protein